MKYTEWQRSSGLKVLRRVLDRQKILETTDGIANRTQVQVRIVEYTGTGTDSRLQRYRYG